MIECIDLFAGAGGFGLGLRNAGLRVPVAVDFDKDCERTYTLNCKRVKFLRRDITKLSASELLNCLKPNSTIVLAGGPPCQLFSQLNRKHASNTKELKSYVRLVREIKPSCVVFENVPAIRRRVQAWNYLIGSLTRLGYVVNYEVLKAADFGVPQRRERLIVIASMNGIDIPTGIKKSSTVKDAIGHLPVSSNAIKNHVTMKLSDQNLKRIKLLKAGQSSKSYNSSFPDSYSRMHWDRLSPTITTKCISFSNGRFGHPKFDRALTVREAAILQGFPESFEFVGSLWSCARQVGNAVPPPLAEAIGKRIRQSLSS